MADDNRTFRKRDDEALGSACTIPRVKDMYSLASYLILYIDYV